ncbi:hypothetical protein JVU11DRAFT_5127 [Chiua virens]|nr:hypothetical protein JVU11DRAFT_5127 [Chiua virens]
MSSTSVNVSTTPTSGSPAVSPSSISQTSATDSSGSSSDPSSISGTSSSDSPSSTSGSPDSSTIPSTTETTAAITSPSTTTFQPDTTTSTSISAIFSTLDTAPSTIAFSTPSGSTSQSTSPEITNMPLTTVLQSTTIVITSTNSQGQVVTSVPPVVTEVITTTGNGGVVTTVTQAVINPTLAPNNSTSEESAFFADTGAVVGVFVVVGLACAAILLWILFAIRHRQRMVRIEQETAVEAAVAAAGLHRAPLDDDDDDSPILPSTHRQFRPFSTRMGQRSFWGFGSSASLPPSARHSEVLGGPARDGVNSHTGLPVEHHARSHLEGYVPARATSPSSLNRVEQATYDLSSSRGRKSSYGHTPTYSAGSFEPLLANYTQNMSDQDTSADIMEVPRSTTTKQTGTSSAPNKSSLDGEDVSRPSLKRQDSSSSYVLRDEDYKSYVLMASIHPPPP